MRNSVIWRRMVCALLMLLLLTGVSAAVAEEELFSGEVELYSRGALPEEMPALVSTFGVNRFEDYILEQLNAQAERIDVSAYQLSPSDFQTAYQRLVNSHPELFFVDSGYSYYMGSYVTSVLPQYTYTGNTLKNMQEIYNDGVSAVVDYACSASTDVGRMLRASDYMCANFEYDTNHTIYSPELLFLNKTGVCQAYMLAYRAVLNELGIPNIAVTSREINHTWNMVYLDGSWYHIDVTWNDPVSDMPLRAYHTNFLLSDAGITATGHTGWDDGWEGVVAADNTKYDSFFWINLKQVASMQGDVVYYVDSVDGSIERNVYAYDLASNTASKLLTYSYGYGVYYKHFNPIWVSNGTIYYAVRDSLYSVTLASGESKLVYSTGNSSQWIWYPYQSGSQMKMYVAESPSGEGSIHSCELNVKYALTLNHAAVQMEIGDTVQLKATLAPAAQSSPALTWSGTDKTIAAVSSAGKVSAVSAGVAVVSVKYDENTTASCTVIVNPQEKLTLPGNTVKIQKEAFAGIASGMIVLPDGITTIGSKAFADNDALLLVNLPDSLTSIAADAFDGCANVTLLCAAGSVGEAYAVAQRIPYVIVP